jgi:hypothetical protein
MLVRGMRGGGTALAIVVTVFGVVIDRTIADVEDQL